MDVVVQLESAVAEAWAHRGPAAAEERADVRDALQRIGNELAAGGLTLTAQFPDIDDPELSRYFAVTVADPATARHLAERLLECPGVSAAYVKPAATPP